MTGYYGPINKELLQSLKITGNDIANYDGFQEYRYSYFPEQKKYQILATLENPEYSKIGRMFPTVITTVYAEDEKTGYPFIKGNFANTGGINNIIVSSDVWDAKTPNADGIKVFSGTEAINGTGPIVVAPPSNVPVNGECGADNNTNQLATPVNLCSKGTPTIVTDGGVNNNFTWTCSGIYGGTDETSCHATHAPGACKFDESKFDQCVFP